MEFFKQNTNINFMGLRKWTAVFSVILFIASISSLVVNGINWGLDFTGGTQIELQYNNTANLSQIRQKLADKNYEQAVVQNYGASTDVLVTLPAKSDDDNQAAQASNIAKERIETNIAQALPDGKIMQVNYVGPQVGKELANKGILAIIVAMLFTMIYIALRFEYRFGLSSTLALIHDPVIILGVFSYFHLEFNLIALASILTVIGYSLNDTIVVFDRVRENFRKVRKGTPVDIMNLSINQTLSRTIMTSFLTMLAVVSLFLFGGPVLHGFSVAFIVGILVGTYSSIYVAGAAALALGLKREDLIPTPKEELDDRP